MPLILAIETATEICSVSLIRDNEIIAIRESEGSNEHSALLASFIDEVMKETGFQYQQLDAVAVSKGPGSYTGLRIGVSTAKGLCYAMNKPLISVGTLEAMAFQVIDNNMLDANNSVLLCPMIDARRMEVYTAVFDAELEEVSPVIAEIIDENSFAETQKKILIFGNGATKCMSVLKKNEKVILLPEIRTSSVSVAKIAAKKFKQSLFEDIAYFEPFYLKDFVAGIPRVKGLH